MAEKVYFDGPNKLIIVNFGEIELDAQEHIYSDWKEWVQQGDNAKFLPALRTVGGDSISVDQTISPYYFLINGWRIRPFEDEHRLVIIGNLFVDGGGSPFVPSIGDYNIVIELQTSVNAVTTTLEVSTGSGLSQTEHDRLFELPLPAEVATSVWSETLSGYSGQDERAAEIVQRIQQLVKLLPGAL